MSAFEYQALDKFGKKKKGLMEADSMSMVREKLKKMELFPVIIKPINEKKSDTKSRKFSELTVKDLFRANPAKQSSTQQSKYRLKPAELTLVTRQLAILLQSGLTIEDSLKALVKQSETYSSKAVLQQVLSGVTEGRSLADSMSKNTKTFPEIYIASVTAGEQTGKLGEIFERLAEYTEKREALKRNINGALIYPIILITVSVLILVFLLTVIVPKIVNIFNDSGQELPFITQVVIGLSELLQHYGWLMLIIIIVMTVFAKIYFREPKAKYRLHKWFLTTPGIKRTIRGLNSARMARTLSILVGSGVPLLTSMNSAKNVVTNLVIRKAVEVSAKEVSEGASLGKSLERTKVFPPMLVQMVQSGEMSGRLPEMLERAAHVTESELESRISSLVKIFEPMMILVMGGIVMIIVLAILLPIFELNQIVG